MVRKKVKILGSVVIVVLVIIILTAAVVPSIDKSNGKAKFIIIFQLKESLIKKPIFVSSKVHRKFDYLFSTQSN